MVIKEDLKEELIEIVGHIMVTALVIGGGIAVGYLLHWEGCLLSQHTKEWIEFFDTIFIVIAIAQFSLICIARLILRGVKLICEDWKHLWKTHGNNVKAPGSTKVLASSTDDPPSPPPSQECALETSELLLEELPTEGSVNTLLVTVQGGTSKNGDKINRLPHSKGEN
jgi:hypothetical protein